MVRDAGHSGAGLHTIRTVNGLVAKGAGMGHRRSFYGVGLSVRNGGAHRKEIRVVIRAASESDAAARVHKKYEGVHPKVQSVKRES